MSATIKQEAVVRSAIEAISFAVKVQRLGESRFVSCISLVRLAFGGDSTSPEDCLLETISSDAFAGSTLEAICLSDSVRICSPQAFRGWKGFEVSESNIHSRFAHAFFFRTENNNLIQNVPELPDSTILDDVTIPRESCFESCNTIETLRFADDINLIVVEARAFAHSSLKQVALTIRRNIEKLGKNCAAHCQQLTGLTFLPESRLTHVGDDAFLSYGLTVLVIHSTVISIGRAAFSSCATLPQVIFVIRSCFTHFPDPLLSKLIMSA
jgi:hypothetical protein